MIAWLIWSVPAGVLAGWLAGRLLRGNGFGLLGDVVVGVIGAVVGGYLLHVTGMNLGGGVAGIMIVAFIGAALLLFIVRLFTGRRDGRRLWS